MELPEIAYCIVRDAQFDANDDKDVFAAARAFLLKQFENQLEVQEVQKDALRRQLSQGSPLRPA